MIEGLIVEMDQEGQEAGVDPIEGGHLAEVYLLSVEDYQGVSHHMIGVQIAEAALWRGKGDIKEVLLMMNMMLNIHIGGEGVEADLHTTGDLTEEEVPLLIREFIVRTGDQLIEVHPLVEGPIAEVHLHIGDKGKEDFIVKRNPLTEDSGEVHHQEEEVGICHLQEELGIEE